MKTKLLTQQVALITGGATGIGRSFTEALAYQGVRVVIASRRREVLEQTADEINSLFSRPLVFPYVFDVRNLAQTEALVKYVVQEFGSLDVLINNSGLAVSETVTEISEDGWDKVLETNLRGAMWLTRAALPQMIEQDFGDIVNISSQAGKNGYADVPSYCAAKFGLLGFAESLRDDVRKRGANVRVFNFCPGLVEVERAPEEEPRPGFVHVRNMAQTLIYALALDRNVVLPDISLYAR